MSLYDHLLKHPLAANILMFLMLLAGVWGFNQLQSQLFPNFEFARVNIQVELEGASAERVRNQLLLPIESQLSNLSQVASFQSVAQPGRAQILVNLADGINPQQGRQLLQEELQDLNFPAGTSELSFSSPAFNEDVARLLLYGQVELEELAALALQAQQQLLAAGLTEVQLSGMPRSELVIEVDANQLLALGMSLDDLARRIQTQFRSQGAGRIQANADATQLVLDAPDWSAASLRQMVLQQTEQGILRLGDVARIQESLVSGQSVLEYQGMPAVGLRVRRSADQDSLENAERLMQWQSEFVASLPDSLSLRVYGETWRIVQAQLQLVLSNGIGGMLLVILVLFLFLRSRTALWVAAGLPVAFLGTLAAMGVLNISLNTISLFGFIIALGIIVDDAIVVAEDATQLKEQGMPGDQAARTAAKRMFPAVLASSLTTIAAFMPLVLIGGQFGSFIIDIPLVVTLAILASLIECFIILPGHLAHSKVTAPGRLRLAFDAGFQRFQQRAFLPLIQQAMRQPFLVLSLLAVISMLTLGLVQSGRVAFVPQPNLEGQTLNAQLAFHADADPEVVRQTARGLAAKAEAINQQLGGEFIINILLQYNDPISPTQASLSLELTSDTDRPLTNAELIAQLQQDFVAPDDLRSFTFGRNFRGPGGSGDLGIELWGADIRTLKQASERLQAFLQDMDELEAVSDNLPWGDLAWQLQLTPEAVRLGVSAEQIASQLSALSSSLQLAEIDHPLGELPVRLRLPEHERNHISALGQLPIQLGGQSLPLASLAEGQLERSLDRISARNGRVAIVVSATDNSGQLSALYPWLEDNILAELAADYGIQYRFTGEAEALQEFFSSTRVAIGVAMLMIVLILAWVFASWIWTAVVLITLPFGLIGAVLGHWLMGLPLSTVSILGFIGLSGIVVNNAIVLVSVYRRQLKEGHDSQQAIINASLSRLRPVLLTTLTTMLGLTPLMLETSLDAALLQPMAVGIVFGLGFATLLILIVLPVLMSLVNRSKLVWHRGWLSITKGQLG